jgi:hypothetical protein
LYIMYRYICTGWAVGPLGQPTSRHILGPAHETVHFLYVTFTNVSKSISCYSSIHTSPYYPSDLNLESHRGLDKLMPN